MENSNGIIEAVVVPLSQSLISGAFIGITVGSLGLVFDWPNPTSTGLLFGSVVSSISWFSLRASWQRRLESVLGIVEAPVQTATNFAQTVKVNFVSDDKLQGEFLKFPISYEKLHEFAIGICAGKSFTDRAWVGSRKLFHGGEFEDLRFELELRGFSRWRNSDNHNLGMEITKKGFALLRGISSKSDSPTSDNLINKLKFSR